jgi:regulator of RNase E activity RraB
MIDRNHLTEMFQKLQDNGLSGSDPLLWGFFFADHDPEKLEVLVPALESRGYKFVDLYEAESEEEFSEQLYCLHVEKVEQHNIDTLETRMKELRALAEQYGVESYDGMEVGPVDQALELHESNN